MHIAVSWNKGLQFVPTLEMTNTEEQNEIAHLRSLLKDKEDEIARLKLLIGTAGLPVSKQKA